MMLPVRCGIDGDMERTFIWRREKSSISENPVGTRRDLAIIMHAEHTGA